jgi:hypothetical protein
MNETGQGKRALVSRLNALTITVFADGAGLDGMLTMYAAPRIADWGHNVNAKISITNTLGQSSADLIGRLSGDGVIVNVTSIKSAPSHRRRIREAIRLFRYMPAASPILGKTQSR